MTQSEQIFQWLEDNRDFFKPEGICKKIGIDKGNFSKYRAAKSIPEKYIKPIVGILINFGFKNTLPAGDGFNKALITKTNIPTNGIKVPFIIVSDKQKRIEAILAEKIPEHRNTRLGKIFWKKERDERVLAIQNEKDG